MRYRILSEFCKKMLDGEVSGEHSTRVTREEMANLLQVTNAVI